MSMMLSALPDPQTQINSLQRALAEKTKRVEQLEEALRQERNKNAGTEAGVSQLRATLTPLFQALQLVFGHIDAMEPGPVSHAKAAVWESWKQKLGGGLTGRAIDALMLHGPMNQTQLRIQLSCATRTVTNIVGALNKAGLINKVDGKIALKEI